MKIESLAHPCVLAPLIIGSWGCGNDDHADKSIKALEQRVARIEATLGTPAPTATSSSSVEQAIPELQKRVSKIEALEQDVARSLKTVRKPLELDKTGNEVCAEKGHTCLAVVDTGGSSRVDVNNVFCGHIVADCNSRITKRLHCVGNANYVLSPVKFWRSPGAKGQCGDVGNETCQNSPSNLTAICLN